MKKMFVSAVVALLLNTACSDEGKEIPVVPEPEVPSVTVEKMALTNDQLDDMQNEFAFSMFKAASAEMTDKDNLFISPQSASIVLAMLANEDAEELQEGIKDLMTAIGFDGETYSVESLNECNQQLMQTLLSAPKSATFTISNSVWSTVFSGSLGETLQKYYNAHCGTANLNKAEGIKEANEWVSEATAGMIPQIFSNPLLNVDRAYISAMLLKADWSRRFNPDFTALRPFTNLDGSVSEVELMCGEMNKDNIPYLYNFDDDCAMVSIGLDSNRFYADFILPNEGIGINEFIIKFNNEQYRNLIDKLYSVKAGTIVLPKFEISEMYSLNSVFSAQGMDKLFGADMIKAQQFTHIAINEKGIDAAAASSVTIDYGLGNDMPVDTYFVRPFVYVIREAKTGTILFMGKVTKL